MLDAPTDLTLAGARSTDWWEKPWFLALMIALAAIPLLYPPIPPLVDLPGHMGRNRVALDLNHSLWLQQYFGFRWALIGNLGVDLLVMPLGRLIGLEPAVKLIVLAIPPLTVAGFLWVAREVHGRVPPTALFALPFVYGFPFLFGFLNFALSVALAFLAFGLWLRLGRLGRTRLRGWLFVPISLIVFFAHIYGWGLLGLLCFSADAVRLHDRGRSWIRACVEAALHTAVMALPILIMLAWRSETQGGETAAWFDWQWKWRWIYSALRDRWQIFDIGSLVMAGLVFVYALVSGKLTLSRNLAFSAIVLAASFILLPRIVFGSAYADMRLLPYLFAVALLAIRFKRDTHLPTARLLAGAGLAFVLVRIVSTSLSLGIAADDQNAKLAALDHVPAGARVIAFVGRRCGDDWELPRNDHLGSMVIVRRFGFSNDQWPLAGSSLLTIRNPRAGRFAHDPSQKARPRACAYSEAWPIETSLRQFPRDQFDYLWLIDPPAFDPALLKGATRVWSGPGSALYRLSTQP
jgi:hypothetical protein